MGASWGPTPRLLLTKHCQCELKCRAVIGAAAEAPPEERNSAEEPETRSRSRAAPKAFRLPDDRTMIVDADDIGNVAECWGRLL